MTSSSPSSRPRISVAVDTLISRHPKKALGATLGVVAALPLLAASPAQALTSCASVATTLTAADSCTIIDGDFVYAISIFTTNSLSSFESAFRSPSTSGMFWWGDNNKAKIAAREVGAAFGLPNTTSESNNNDVGSTGPWFAFTIPSGFFEDRASVLASYFYPVDPYVGSVLFLQKPDETKTAVWASSAAVAYRGRSLVPGPLPILGLAAAFGFSRQLRKRIKLHKGTSDISNSSVA